jgi:hypothetical protein
LNVEEEEEGIPLPATADLSTSKQQMKSKSDK